LYRYYDHIRYDAENTQNSLYISIKSQFKQRCAHVYFSHLTTQSYLAPFGDMAA